MDIHRCRFIPYPASPINALAFSHTSDLTHRAPKSLRLAVGRANGDIEIWNPAEGRWVQEKILRGSQDRSIEGLTWTQDPTHDDEDGKKTGGRLRLFSIGYSTVVTEWDLATGKPLRHSSGTYGEIWCLAAQPKSNLPRPTGQVDEEEKCHQKLVVGCADGALVLHSTAGYDLRYLHMLPRPSKKKVRVLSVAWQNAERIVAGYSDNAIRVYDARGRGRNIHTMSIAANGKRGPSEVLVWAVKCLPDGTIISGDSSGEIKIWDSATLSLVQQLKNHNADVLALSPSLDGKSLLSGGIDRRTVTYRRIESGKSKGRWAAVSHRRLHTSDVKTMASYEAKDMSVAVSGGLDATPIVLPRSGLGLEYHRRLAVHPNAPPLQSAPSRRLIMSYWGAEVRVWRVGQHEASEIEGAQDDGVLSHKLVAKIALQGQESIASATLSEDGSMLAVATVSATKVFRLQQTSAETLRIQKMKLPTALAGQGSNLLEFSPDSKWLLQVQLDASPLLYRVCWNNSHDDFVFEPKAVQLQRRDRTARKLKARDGTHGEYARSIERGAWSKNSRILVTCDVHGDFDSWILEGHEDLTQGDDNLEQQKIASPGSDDEDSDEDEPVVVFGQRWVELSSRLPKLGASPLVLSFRPDLGKPENGEKNIALHPTRHNPHPHSRDLPEGEDRLVVVSSQNQLFEYHVMNGTFTDWSRRNPPEMLPQDFQSIRERAMGCAWDVSAGSERLWLYGSSWLWMFNLSVDLNPDTLRNGTSEVVPYGKKRKREPMASETKALMQNTSGAGSRIPYADQDSGMMPAMLETDGDRTDWISFEASGKTSPDEDEDGQAVTEPSADLVKFRRRDHSNGTAEKANGIVNGDVSMEDDHGDNHGDADQHAGPVRHWGTFKYRPILGIVPIGTSGKISATNIEVALVERPLWDVDLPARWEGDQEWDR